MHFLTFHESRPMKISLNLWLQKLSMFMVRAWLHLPQLCISYKSAPHSIPPTPRHHPLLSAPTSATLPYAVCSLALGIQSQETPLISMWLRAAFMIQDLLIMFLLWPDACRKPLRNSLRGYRSSWQRKHSSRNRRPLIAMWDAETRQEVGPPPSDSFSPERLCFHKVPQPSIIAPVVGGCLFVPCCPDLI